MSGTEIALVAVTGLHLCFLPWAFGAMHLWSQYVSLALAGFGFALSLVIDRGERKSASRTGSRLTCTLPARWPGLWLGIAVLVYITVQGLNPSWQFRQDGSMWWLEPTAHVGWLPTGVTAPLARSNPWRVLLVWGSLLLLLCSMRFGLTRRKGYSVLFWVIAINGLLLSLLGLFQKLAGTQRIFWTYRFDHDAFFSSFIYPNHAGPFFYVLFSLSVGLAWSIFQRSRQQSSDAGLVVVALLIAAFQAVSVILSTSRASIVVLILLGAAFGCLALLSFRRLPSRLRRDAALPLASGLLIAGLVGGTFVGLHREQLTKRFSSMLADPTSATHVRFLAQRATFEMAAARPWFGWGAGSFRHAFPLYAQKYPELGYIGAGKRVAWENAHNDHLQLWAELGLVGLLPLAAIGILVLRTMLRLRAWRDPLVVCVTTGFAAVFVHAGVDFVFQNPAVLFTSAALLMGVVRYYSLDQLRASAGDNAIAGVTGV